ncbi:putative colanic acid biosynthesis acetyltransferase [Methylomonas sp. LL1]|uniref:colanic acid biosynthesis acetyltransferase WcaF n=1 Tax=Methylomonas sp. LL1 TaxID=2785785 RepID=UPI0018C3577A|nr:colanic acid biosynthesis acetyltransferase WcaF [Methylomonas sp. LL1]QPK62728.1 putative colanic acid biosynthesis acetyltransferase [Methylomonas sp. LL1]
MNLDIVGNRKTKKYSRKELLYRLVWVIGKFFFRNSPRIFFGFRRSLLRVFGASVGKAVNIYPSAIIYMPWNLAIGDYAAIGEDALIYNLGKVTIGNYATISHRAHLCAGTHDYSDQTLPLLKPPITIKDNAWVCAQAFIGPGVTVHEGAVIGAAAVVTKDVDPWTVVAGNPARMIKQRILKTDS